MIPAKIKRFVARAFSAVFGLGLFIVLLPVTVGLTLVMMLIGLITLTTLRYQVEKKTVNDTDPNSHTTHKQTTKNLHKPPIEGSYTVVE